MALVTSEPRALALAGQLSTSSSSSLTVAGVKREDDVLRCDERRATPSFARLQLCAAAAAAPHGSS
jgi:hypothetical protein